jgi:hypothetical protein
MMSLLLNAPLAKPMPTLWRIIMTEYNVRLDLNSLNFNIEADNEDEAIKKANDFAMNESLYDILKWAEYYVEVNDVD